MVQPSSQRIVRAARAAVGERMAPCPCCALEVPSASLRSFTQRKLCRQLLAPHQRADPPAATGDEWVSGLYRYYHITHEHQVCEACHAHLSAGGEMGGLRNRSKLAFVVMLAVLTMLILSLPILLPHLRSALWLNP